MATNPISLLLLRQMIDRTTLKNKQLSDHFLARFVNCHDGDPVEAFDHIKGKAFSVYVVFTIGW